MKHVRNNHLWVRKKGGGLCTEATKELLILGPSQVVSKYRYSLHCTVATIGKVKRSYGPILALPLALALVAVLASSPSPSRSPSPSPSPSLSHIFNYVLELWLLCSYFGEILTQWGPGQPHNHIRGGCSKGSMGIISIASLINRVYPIAFFNYYFDNIIA